MVLTPTTVVVIFKGGTQWIYSIEDLKEEIPLCTSPTLLPGQMTREAFVLLLVVGGLALCVASVYVSHVATLEAITKRPFDPNFSKVYQSVIDHHERRTKRGPQIMDRLLRGMELVDGDKLCDGKKCSDFTDCKLKDGILRFAHWSAPYSSDKCRLLMQYDGNLVLFNGKNEPISSSDTAESSCHTLTFSGDQLFLSCKRFSKVWHWNE
jgi:hypothetical protein